MPERHHLIWQVHGFTFDGTTLIYTWVAMAIVLALGLLAVRGASPTRPRPLQNAFETMLEVFGRFVGEQIQPRQRAFMLNVLCALFSFILVSNLIGLIPGQTSPTANLNTCLALSIGVFFLVQFSGVLVRGLGGYLRHMKGPDLPYVWPFFAVINVIEELSKPITLSFRLYGNIFAGEMLILVLAQIPIWFGGFIPGAAWYAFSIFVGFIQSFIFVMLTLAYVGIMTSAEH
ncbi:MAG: F0F1 ATP synthase subunit A [Clostridia bacterium]|nr:F0F1 ATP synthase subunit A [Clostridia bacterium]